MKTTSRTFRFLSYLSFALLTMVSASDMIAQVQTKTELGEFIVLVQTTNSNEIKMKCEQGCAWKTLAYKLSEKSKVQAIDEYGIAELEKENPGEDSELTDFLFTIRRNDNGVELKGKEGTAWIELAFSLPPDKEQAINQMGMTE